MWILFAGIALVAGLLAWFAVAPGSESARTGDDEPAVPGDSPTTAGRGLDRRAGGAAEATSSAAPVETPDARSDAAAPDAGAVRPQAGQAGPGTGAVPVAPAGSAASGVAVPVAGPAAGPSPSGATPGPAAGSSVGGGPGGGRRSEVRPALPDVVVSIRARAAESGEPLAGVVVRARFPGGTVREIRSDHAGIASFAAPGGVTFGLDVKAAGRLRVKLDDTVAPADGAAIQLSLVRGVVIAGLVGSEARIRPSVTVAAYDAAAWNQALPFDPDPAPIETVEAGAGGAFRIDCVPRETEITLVARAEGFADGTASVGPHPDPDFAARAVISLETGRELRGRVVRRGADRAPEPAAGAVVCAIDDDDAWRVSGGLGLSSDERAELSLLLRLDRARRGDVVRPPRTRTDAAGSYRLTLPASADELRVVALTPGDGRSPPSPELGPEASVPDLILRGRAEARFDVRAPGGAPSRGAVVRPALSWETWSAPDIGDGLHGPVLLDVGPHIVHVTGGVDAPGFYAGSAPNTDRTVYRIRLDRGRRCTGQVVDDRGEPVAGARVTVATWPVDPDAGGTADVPVTETAKDGTWERLGLSAAMQFVWVRKAGHVTRGLRVEPEWDAGVTLAKTIVLPRAATLRLTLRLPTDARAPRWWRVATAQSARSASPRSWSDRTGWTDGIVAEECDASDDTLHVFVPGYEAVVRTGAVRPGETVDLGNVDLVPTRRVAGTVTDEAGNPVAGAWIRLSPRLSEGFVPDRGVETGRRGEFEVDVPTPGVVSDFVAHAVGFSETPQAWSPESEDPLVVTLGRGRTVRGRVPGLAPPSSRYSVPCVRALGPGGEPYANERIADDGTFEISVPRLPATLQVVEVSWWSSFPILHDRFSVLRTTTVPGDWPDGGLLEIPAAVDPGTTPPR